jgi:hypothetical protein
VFQCIEIPIQKLPVQEDIYTLGVIACQTDHIEFWMIELFDLQIYKL